MSSNAFPQTLTFLFTDIEGSTPLWDRDVDAMRRATARHNALLREAIGAHGGDAFRVVGDAFCVAFANADSAVHAAIAAQRALTHEDWGAAPIRVRMGLHSGAAEAADDEIFRGPALARAARVMTAAHGEQILLTASTVALLDSKTPQGAALRDLGDHTLRGFARAERLYQLIVPGLRAEFPPIGTREALRTNLPPPLTSFIGRELALAGVRKYVRAARMVTLVGAGGTGKTRLMLEAAAELISAFPDGVWLIELAPLADPAHIAQTIAAVLGARAEGDVPALSIVESALAGKRSLLLLDNCEHVIDEAARVAQLLLRALPTLHIVATSREALGVDGEISYRVPSLSLPASDGQTEDAIADSEAVRLFIERARAVVPDFELNPGNGNAIAEICRRLDGIPLALELAAARLTALSVDELAQRLHDRFRLLTGGRRTALPRQRTLRALVDWSYDLLSDDERSVLMTLSAFSGGFTLTAAEAVCDESDLRETSVLDAIERLVAKSLLTTDQHQGTQTRYYFLETIRQYAAEKLVHTGDADTARRRHFDYFVALAEHAEPELRKANVLEWLDRLEAEHDNLRAALDWAADVDARGHARLAGALHDFWDVRGHFVEGFERLERAVELHVTEDAARLKALLGAGALAYRLDKRRYAADLLDATAALAQRLSDTRREAEATLWRACALDAEGADFIESMAEKGLALSRSIDNAWGVGFATWHFALAMYLRDRLADAQRLCLESAAHFDRGGCVLMAALARTSAGQCAVDRLDFDGARALLEDALAEHLRLGNTHDAATTQRLLGKLDLNVGRLTEALRASEESARIFRALQDPNCGARSTLVLAEVLHAMGDDPLALQHAENSTAVQARLGFHHNLATALWLTGRCHETRGNRDAAHRAYFEGLRAMIKTQVTSPLPGIVEAVAGTHPTSSIAPRLLGYAAAVREASNLAVLPSDRVDIGRWIAAVRAEHRDAFESEFAAGRSMTRDDAIAMALTLEAAERTT
ncbi:MAG TPA: tetratricopeptide repeat protein [Casimicrobiaceae bacterium]|jgi:predicted ATPase/class 3 adenylate cyclase/tetratricopeptide (TPR) repeat protein